MEPDHSPRKWEEEEPPLLRETMHAWIQMMCQAISLILQAVWTLFMALGFLLRRTLDAAAGRWEEKPTPTATFYEGKVMHKRLLPINHQLNYQVRVCCLDLDNPPKWFEKHKKLAKTLTADEAREKAGTNGRVVLLTQPCVAGYVMNPISIYFCYHQSKDAQATSHGTLQGNARKRTSQPPESKRLPANTYMEKEKGWKEGNNYSKPNNMTQECVKETNPKSNEQEQLKVGLAEVTNTPWGARVTFAFDPHGHEDASYKLSSRLCPVQGEMLATEVEQSMGQQGPAKASTDRHAPTPKCLHVSPFMDMKSSWILKATLDKDSVFVSVGVTHPKMGNYFIAELDCKKSSEPHQRNEYSSWKNLLKYGFMPHRVAWWIYWHAAVLLWKGVPFVAPPTKEERAKRVESSPWPMFLANGRKLEWEDPIAFPWHSDT